MSKEQKQIDVLRYPDCVRLRKGMYLMNPDHCVFEMVDNAVDECAAGSADTIVVAAVDDTESGQTIITVEDNGSGIPMTLSTDPEYAGLAQAEVAYTVLHAGGKFGTSNGYKTSTGGMNGVGASAVNAVSEWCHLVSRSNGEEKAIDFAKGITINHCYDTGEVPDQTGTMVQFVLDPEIWGMEWYDFGHIKRRLQQLAYLNSGLKIVYYVTSHDIEGNEVNINKTFMYDNGLLDYIAKIAKGKNQVIEPALVNGDFEFSVVDQQEVKGEDGSIRMEGVESKRAVNMDFCFTYVDQPSSDLKTFVNNVATENGGDHETGFKEGIFRAVKRYATENKSFKDVADITSDDCREGMVGILSVKLKDPNFEGQGKSKLRMPEVRAGVRKGVEEYFYDFLSQDPAQAKAILVKVELAVRVRKAAKKARDNERKLNKLTGTEGLPGKLADCRCKDPEDSECFFVEGDSAGGSAKQGRDPEHQAILPVFGKIPNVIKMTFDKILASEKLKDISRALGCGMGPTFDITKVRYHKIVLMADADVDGWHINCLHITNIYRNMRPLIEAGYIYIACPPLYKVTKKVGRKEEITYLYTPEELDAFDTEGCSIQRYKGLGEMNPEQLWETTMNPETRRLVQVTMDDAELAEEIITACMDEDSSARREFVLYPEHFTDNNDNNNDNEGEDEAA